jgi:hypothetical protein
MGYALTAGTGARTATTSPQKLSFGGQWRADSLTEADVQFVTRIAGVLSNFSANATTTTGTSRTATVRVNGANGNGTISWAGGASGVATDGSHTDALSAGDKINLVFSYSGSNPTLSWFSALFSATGTHACFYPIFGSAKTFSTDLSTIYIWPAGQNNMSTTEANQQVKCRTAATLKNAQCSVNVNARVTDSTVKSRINGADGTIAITVTAGVTGIFEDTTHTDALASGDLYDFSITNGVGTSQALTFQTYGCSIQNDSTAQNDIFATSGSTRAASATASYAFIIGNASTNATETNQTIEHGFALTASKMRIFVSDNTYAADATMRLRKNAADGSQNITLTAGVTGWFEDSTNTDSIIATDNVCYSIVGGTSGSITYQSTGLTETPVGAAAIFTKSLILNQAVARAAYY